MADLPMLVLGRGPDGAPVDAPRGRPGPTIVEPVYDGLPPMRPLPDGWRWETYGGIELQVPAHWRTGGTRQPWCAALGENPGGPIEPEPYVSRPGATLAVLCGDEPRDRWTPYLEFGGIDPLGRVDLGDGWVLETREVGDVLVTVRADDQALLDRILGSARTVDEVDAVGCPLDYAVMHALDARPTTGALDPTEVGPDGVVCQYGLGEVSGQTLAASRRLSADEVRAFVEAYEAAPAGGGPDEPDSCLPETRRGDMALLVRLPTTSGARDVVVWYSGCVNGADDGAELRTLTADLLKPLFGDAVVASFATRSVSQLIH